ncbi:type II toxin-antitoxin system RelE/ParE family toxin [Salipiger sp. P9]|uniref:type II toxin-antitoxin system RelE/ParE family toxin n=1 Tax=Salipiger pentaromativorans TaxID=2943193 RepID=UPI0021573810|nr:type II toxin-antitoxin system RelE/ParE family toxin [Salipiger pentaromativorans]
MSHRIDVSQEAERDLIGIYLFGLERFGVAQAERYAGILRQKIELVAEHPDFGADVGFVRAGARRYVAVSHVIYYRPIPGGIRVLRILHGHMDPGRHLS